MNENLNIVFSDYIPSWVPNLNYCKNIDWKKIEKTLNELDKLASRYHFTMKGISLSTLMETE